MAKLSITYEHTDLLAILSSDQSGSAWEAVRRVCEDYSDEVSVLSSTALQMPWWAFLGCRSAIGYYVSRFNMDLSLDDAARSALENAAEQDSRISTAAKIPDLDQTATLKRLRGAGFERDLKAFQLRNVVKLARLPVGATFSVPGSGKTTEALAFYVLQKQAGSRLLVICPKNAFAAWEEQLSECMPGYSHEFVRLTGGPISIARILRDRNPYLMLITYQQFLTISSLITAYLHRFDSFIFLDESHRIKRGVDGKIANAILRAAPVARGRLVMTGTPLPNSISDLVPQIKFLTPQAVIDEDSVEAFIKPIYVRTRKSELDLPDIKRIQLPISMTPGQRRLYQLMRSELARQMSEFITQRDRLLLRQMGRSALTLLQFASNPALLGKRDFAHAELLADVLDEGDSPKVEYACKRARMLAKQGRKTIIWSSFVENVEVISARLVDLGADYIHGGVEASSDFDEDSREAKIRTFHDDPHAFVLVANPAACGEGISLHTVCHNAIYVDRTYNAAQYLQSEDRIHRIGLKPTDVTYVEILCCSDSVDESVERRLRSKIAQMARVLDDEDLNIAPIPLDPDDLALDDDDFSDFLTHILAEAAI
ncbi:MAG TPA: DEAD/DEAH box helicase [Stellaceae bacterium]|nr:DEAD/DEAH box helicase [Stellaceae bacterium]